MNEQMKSANGQRIPNGMLQDNYPHAPLCLVSPLPHLTDYATNYFLWS